MAGWEPRTFTRFQYDDAGRLIGSVSWTEPEWSVHDVDQLVASHEYDRELDPNGFPMSEATSPEADPANRDGAFYFKAGQHAVNYAEQARATAEARFKADNPDADMRGVFFPVMKVQRTPKPKRRS